MMPWAVLGGAVSLLIVMIVAVAVVWNLKNRANEQARRDAATKPDDRPILLPNETRFPDLENEDDPRWPQGNAKSPTPETPSRPSPDKPKSSQPDTAHPKDSGQSNYPKPHTAIRPIPNLPELPEGWSYNRPDWFVAAWPVNPGPDGLTPDATLVHGQKGPFGGDRLGMTVGPDQSITLGVSYESAPGVVKDVKKTLDDYFAKLIAQVPASHAIRDGIDVGDRTGRELRYTDKNRTVILRAVVVYNTIWSVRVSYRDDQTEIPERFLNSFFVPEFERSATGKQVPVIRNRPSPQPLNPAKPGDNPKSDKPKRPTPPLPLLPEGWSYNSPTLGFVAAWPTEAGDNGFTPEGALGNGRLGAFGGTKWGMTVGKTESVTLGVSVQVLLDKTIDEKKVLDDYIAKLIKEIPFGYELRPECKIGDRIGREIKFPDKNNKTVILRAVIADNAIWSVQATYLDNEKTVSEKFINSFLVP
jgi:hypothetical protein